MVKTPLVRGGCASVLRCGAARPANRADRGGRVLGRDGGWADVVDTNDVGGGCVVDALGDRPGTWIGVARTPWDGTPSNCFPAPGGGGREAPVS